ncbi:hypothetical protein [Bacillus ndiopicus]|uniref:hypothetical protein n=1 Tax=Bacillus ndiopicus TaxID=1347368 RepID=UPI0005AA1FC0|nr:hypothetical protein [Bacillus ndiopicus]
MKRIMTLLALCLLFATQSVSAHTMTEKNIYEDIDPTAENAQKILLLNSLGLLGYNSEDMKLSQEDNLSRMEFAAWIADFFHLEGENFEQKANASLQEEYVSSLEGDITYNDLNMALFHKELKLDNPDATLTKAQYIDFIFEHLNYDMNGHTLPQMGGFVAGPTGVIDDVKTVDEATILVIGGKDYPLSGHPRVSASSDKAQDWVGSTVDLSYFTTGGGGHGHHGEGHEQATEASTEAALHYVQLQQSVEEENSTSKWLMPSIIIAILAILALLFLKRK